MQHLHDTIYNRLVTGLLPPAAGAPAPSTLRPAPTPQLWRPPLHLAQAILASALAVAQGELCATLVGNARATALAATSSPAAGAGAYAAAGALSYAFRGDNTRGGALPFGIDNAAMAGSGALAPATVQLAVLLPLAALASWPSFALAPPGASTTLSLAWMFSPACGGAGPVTVLALARDECAGGLAAVKVVMTPALAGLHRVASRHRRAGRRHCGHAVGHREGGGEARFCAANGGGRGAAGCGGNGRACIHRGRHFPRCRSACAACAGGRRIGGACGAARRRHGVPFLQPITLRDTLPGFPTDE